MKTSSTKSKTTGREGGGDGKTVIYGRVSTNRQETARQVSDLEATAERQGWALAGGGAYLDTITGASTGADRKAMGQVLALARAGKVERVLVTEMSRLGRSVLDCLETLRTLHANGVSVWVENLALETLGPDGQVRPHVQLILTTMASLAEFERELLRERIASGLAESRRARERRLRREHPTWTADEVKAAAASEMGRPKGSKQGPRATVKRHKRVATLLREGERNVSRIAKLAETSRPTVHKVREALVELGEIDPGAEGKA